MQGEVRTSIQDILFLQLEVNKQINEKEQMKALFEQRLDAAKEFFRFLQFSPFFEDIMNDFNDKSKTLLMFVDENKEVRLRKANAED